MFNYNATLKIDDQDFKFSNEGVWCHSLHELQSRETFTPWSSYGADNALANIAVNAILQRVTLDENVTAGTALPNYANNDTLIMNGGYAYQSQQNRR